jgi:hypothetical protein
MNYRAPQSLASAILASALVMGIGCATDSPKIVLVSQHTRTQTVEPADEDIFVRDRASRFRQQPRDLPPEAQSQEFVVQWRGSDIRIVKFEYRQVNKPIEISVQTHSPTLPDNRAATFTIRGQDYLAGGKICAWRVSLWNGAGQCMAEKQSVLW